MENLTQAVCSIFGLPNLLEFETFPREVFGVFITLTRSITINKWPENIHGCLGYWEKDYQVMDKRILENKIMQLAYDTAFKDSRKEYFPPIYSDPDAEIKISYMLLPLYEVDGSFDNSRLGVIYDNGKERATYLPGVFSDQIPTRNIMKSLKEKSGTRHNDKGEFFSYKTLEISKSLYESIFSSSYLEAIVNNYLKFMFMLDRVPYSIKGDKIIYKKNQDVRNMAVLATLMRINKEHFATWYNHETTSGGKTRQALASVYEITRDQHIAEYLWSERDKLEDIFERPQVLIALSESKYVNMIKKYVLERMKSFKLSGIEDVFKANWWGQLVMKLNLHKYKDIFINYFLEIYHDVLESETNYLVVFFEGLSEFLSLSGEIIKIPLFNVFINLLHRYNIRYGLLEFTDKSMRVDITNHFVNSIISRYGLYEK